MDNSTSSGEKPPSSGKKLVRKSYDYQPNLWGDLFITYTPPLQESKEWTEKRVEQLKREVRTMLKSTAKVTEAMNLLDTIQHLGIAYHFENEIDDAMTHLKDGEFESNDLHEVALHFRLLRQHGFDVTCDEFLKFKINNASFDDKLSGDARGLLSLYNGAYLGVPGEEILDEAISFAKCHLQAMVDDLRSPLKDQVSRALITPLPRMMKWLEARWFIDEYEKEETPNLVLLELSKLNFNVVQSLHCEELKALSLWWKEINMIDKLYYVRDRIVEVHFWSIGMYFEPQFSRARVIFSKTFLMIFLMDDTYDVYATSQESQLLTDAIQRWDKKVANILPEALNDYYVALLDFPKEIERELEYGEKYRASYIIDHFKNIAQIQMRQVGWYAKQHTPTFAEGLETALESAYVFMLNCISYIGMGEIATNEIFLWASSKPRIFRASSEVARFVDDVVGYDREHDIGQAPSTVDFYMKEHNVSKEETFAKILSMSNDAWKTMNQACLRPTEVSCVFLERAVNMAAMVEVVYVYFADGFNKCSNLKDCIRFLILKPIPL